MKTLECDKSSNRADRLVRTLTAEEIVDWLIEYKGLPPDTRENVVSNIGNQFGYHELKGRMWRGGLFAALVAYFEWRRTEKVQS